MQICKLERFSPQYLQPAEVYKKGQWTTLPEGAAPSLTVQIISFNPLQHKQVAAVVPSSPGCLSEDPGAQTVTWAGHTHTGVPVAMGTEVVSALRCKWG